MKAKKIFALVVGITMYCSSFQFNIDSYAAKEKPKKNYKVYLKHETIEGKTSNEKIKAKSDTVSKSKIKPYIVVFTGPVTEEMKEKLKKEGVNLIGYMPVNSFLSLIKSNNVEKIKELEFVSDIINYLPEHKTDTELKNKIKQKPEEESKFEIRTFEMDIKKVREYIGKTGGKIEYSKDMRTIISSKYKNIEEIVKLDDVKFVSEISQYKVNNDVARGIIGAEFMTSVGYTGLNQTICVADTGLDTGIPGLASNTLHKDFGKRVYKIIGNPINQNGVDKHGHGTHVAGSILGDGTMSNGKIKGTAPDARLIMQAVGNESGSIGFEGTLYDLLDQAYGYGARIHSNSWSKDTHGEYTTECVNLDRYIWEHPDMTVLFSAGNSGISGNKSVGSPSTAKNCITVGATVNYRPYLSLVNDPAQLVDTSSYGCQDGRIKPDILAPGYGIASARSSQMVRPVSNPYPGNTNYHYMNGTSMSTPLTAGAVAAIRQYIQECYEISSPSAALIKAMIINGASTNIDEMDKKGWGSVNLLDSLYPTNIIDSESSVVTNQKKTYMNNCYVSNSDMPLKATLVWTDYPCEDASASIALVNDLDLTVTAPDGTVYNGNDFISPYNSERDSINNVESIIINKPMVGTYKIEVAGTSVPQGPQPFSLVYSAAFLSSPKNLKAKSDTNSITLNWSAVPGANGYEIEIDGSNSPVKVTGTNYTHGGLDKNTLHKYKVRANSTSGIGLWSNTLERYTSLEIPEVRKEVQNNGINLTWDPVEGADIYEIYIDDEEYVPYATTNKTSHLMAITEPDELYNIVVRAKSAFNEGSKFVGITSLDSGISYMDSMNYPRWNFGVSSSKGKVYVFGGKDNNGVTGWVEEYSPTDGKWVTKGVMPVPVYGGAAVEGPNGKIYIFGGTDGSTYQNKVYEYVPENNTWNPKANMKYERAFHKGVYLNGKIYIMGGNNNSPVYEVEVFDPVNNTWTTSKPMMTSKSNFGIAVANGKIITMGGETAGNKLATVEEYDPVQNKWNTKKNMEVWNSDFAMVELDGKVLLIGGENSDKITEYDPVNESWVHQVKLPSSLYKHEAVALGNEIFIPGGYDGISHTNKSIKFIKEKIKWTKNAQMKRIACSFSLAEANGKIYVFGGAGGSSTGLNTLKTVQEYDPITDKWILHSDMPYPRMDVAIASLNDKIYICGGKEEFFGGPTEDTTFYQYDPTSKKWDKKADIPEPLAYQSMIGHNGYIYMTGGKQIINNKVANTPCNFVYRYNPVKDSWEKVKSMNTPRQEHEMVSIKGKIYVIGGRLTSSIEEYDPANDSWTEKNHLPGNILLQNSVVMNDKIYIMENYGRRVFEYDPIKETFIERGNLPFQTVRSDAFSYNNRIYKIGGLCPEATVLTDNLISTDMFAPALSLGSSVMEPRAGTRIVPVKVENIPGDGIYKIIAEIKYDSEKMTLAGVGRGEVIPADSNFTFSNNTSEGIITIQFIGSTASTKIVTEGIFANIEWDISDTSPANINIPLSFSNYCRIYKDNIEQYNEITLSNGSIDVFMYGDVNGDNKVDIIDEEYVKNKSLNVIYTFPGKYGMLAAEVSGDDKVMSSDYTLIRRYVTGAINKFPVQK